MVQPSPRLLARLRFSTKQVARGFYRGTGSGSMGAHTEKGKYIIDFRKTRHYNVPSLEDFRLTPFVSLDIDKLAEKRRYFIDGTPILKDGSDGLKYLREWRAENKQEYEHRQYQEYQQSQEYLNSQESASQQSPEGVEIDQSPSAQASKP
ncbi:hypothetical protein B0A52_00332 [Exophiala mesophila]|uniref:Uncharacterized protein n=1 Tax=Exophiala mesophila TaxID=212818 RepID=A0A438NJT6_EXOME|nr:hypothetical protein B0A52_00332 [Exophiala mesophila]